ncbi:hypothetical protein GCM10011352_14410 [Marinobacterium zhoushanense]|uniref:Large polyvalent protein-associated domain-containing protein n=1 Tax=Marinobacterium zhoushanense TaxID=1679163 RepID=A0ABQ1KB04_9GAMM|nr:CLCA_X family protein [Marinobacterium zhoushanense]GGB89512.1 hypothetical protein GCM10011352_14410 [Marinobacterium zhoushanense]
MKERDYYRNGPDHRAGREIDFALIRRHFDFKTIRIGRWVTAQEQRRAANHFFEALCDLMAILRVPEAVISLRGTLGLHYGTGGRPGVAAHYDAGQRVFALAKNAGPGSIAHEWFHAFDHYIACQAFSGQASGVFGSRAWLHDCQQISHPLNQRLYACYHRIMLNEDGSAPSELVQRSLAMDRQRGSRYYSLPEEVCARAFEAWVQDAVLKNQFLVKGTRQSPEALSGLYPQGEIRKRINEAFSGYFYTLGYALSR